MSFMRRPKGKILKARLGYNANSSSIAAVVTYFLWGAAASVIIINMFAAVAFTKKNTGKDKHESKDRTV